MYLSEMHVNFEDLNCSFDYRNNLHNVESAWFICSLEIIDLYGYEWCMLNIMGKIQINIQIICIATRRRSVCVIIYIVYIVIFHWMINEWNQYTFHHLCTLVNARDASSHYKIFKKNNWGLRNIHGTMLVTFRDSFT